MKQSLEQKTKDRLKKIEKENPNLNIFLHINPKALEKAKFLDKKNKHGKLYGKIIGIKSNISVQGMPITCASKTLEKYIGTFDATVIKKIKKEDGLIIGMLNMDEFASGVSGESSAFGPTQNPSSRGLIPGGSSSGSAAAIAAGFCDITLGSDTGGSIRNPASHCGVIGVKPSYGLVSRYGLLDLCMSLDQIGPLAKTMDDAKLMLDIISGKDDKDTTTYEPKYFPQKEIKTLKIGILKLGGVNPKINSIIQQKITHLKIVNPSWKFKEIKISHIDLAVQTYYPLVYAEFFSATRRLDGRRYGKKIEDFCGVEVFRRIIGGSIITQAEFESAYHQKALKVRSIIKQEFSRVFKNIDCILLPTVPFLPWRIGKGSKMSPEELYSSDALTSPANLAGIPAISIPAGKINNIPVGLQIICDYQKDSLMLKIAKKVEQL